MQLFFKELLGSCGIKSENLETAKDAFKVCHVYIHAINVKI